MKQAIVDPEVVKSLLSEEQTLEMVADAIRKAAVTTSVRLFHERLVVDRLRVGRR